MKYFYFLLLFALHSFHASAACELFDLSVDRSDCNPEKKFTVTINFQYKDVGECFTIKGNGKTYGTFKYTQLPIQLTLTGDCKTEYEFVIRDCKTEGCKLTYLLGKVCCEEECSLSELHIERTECNEEQNFCVYLSFKYQGNSKCFNVTGNGTNYGKFSYSQVPIKICGLKGNCETEYEFVVSDCEKPECSVSGYLGIVCCEAPCKLYDLVLEKGECDEKGKFNVFLNFKYNDSSECFKVYLQGKLFGTYKYHQLPLKLGPFEGDCKTKYEFTVVDCAEETCKVSGSIGPVCCEKKGCSIRDLQIKKSDCNSDKNFFVTIQFKYSNVSSCFIVKGNGKIYGTYQYTQLPITIGPLKGDCKTHYEFIIMDCENESCKASKSIGRVCCEKNRKEEGQSDDPLLHLEEGASGILANKLTVERTAIQLNGPVLLIPLDQGISVQGVEVYNAMGVLQKTWSRISEDGIFFHTQDWFPGWYLIRVRYPGQEKLFKTVKF